jgi:hypothetical protein
VPNPAIPLEKLVYPQLFGGSNGLFFFLVLDSGGGFTSETGGYAL